MFEDAKKNKTQLPFITLEPLYQRIGWNLHLTGTVSLFLAVLCGSITFLGVQLQTFWNYFHVPLPPICRCLQEITIKEMSNWYSVFSIKDHRTSPSRPSSYDCGMLEALQSMYLFCSLVLMAESQQELSLKTWTEILSAPVCLAEHTIHHVVHWSQVMNDNLPTCDRATDLVQNDLENSIFSFPALSFPNM